LLLPTWSIMRLDSHPRAFARALLAGTQGLRSAYIPVFRLPRLPELLLGAHRQWGLRRLLAQDGLGADWVDTYTRALAQSGGLSAALAWYRAATPFSLQAPRGERANTVCLALE
jgi:hypothetical protein